jgi:signal transduction histidine kinase
MTAPDPELETRLTGSEEERLDAARQLRLQPDPSFVELLRQARARESVRWIRTALDEAIAACAGEESESTDIARGDEDSDLRQAYEDGTRDGIRQALHELSPLVGLARAAAEDNEHEDLNRQLDRLRAACSGLRGFLFASSPREEREFDLSKAPREMAESPPIVCPKGVVSARGISPLPVRGDSDLLELALRPVVINAIEAVASVEREVPNSVTISWGLERASCWVMVIDRGPGIDPSRNLLAAGNSSKQGHIGFGLATAAAAMRSLGGQVTLERNSHGGTSALLQWQGAR